MTQFALAPLRQTPTLDDTGRQAYEWERPEDVPANSEVEFAYSAMKLDPVPGELDDPGRGRIRVVNFADVQSYAGDRSLLLASRRARMTAEGRPRLRIRLMYFWGRATAEDEAELDAAGVPPT